MSSTKKTLDPEQITTARPVGRRSAIRAVAAIAIGISATACRTTGCTDSDSGPFADGAGAGRHCGASGCTDSDPRDGVGNGTHCTPPRG
jgi:hypothetical protein